jgi:hypothetical protein
MLEVVLLLPLALAPTAMVAVTHAERRLGPAVAGWLNAVPLSISIAVLGVTTDRGATAGAAVAEAAAAHVPAQVAFSVAFAGLLARAKNRRAGAGGDGAAVGGDASGAAAAGDRRRRRGRGVIAAGLFAGTAVFVALSAVIALVPAPLAIAAAIPALLGGRKLLAGVEGGESEPSGVVVRATVAVIAVTAVLATVRALGPGIGGAVAAYPALTATLAVTAGPDAAARLLRGVVEGLGGYLAFCVALASIAPVLGMASAAPLAVAACAGAFALTWGTVKNGTKMCASGPIETA